MRTIPILIYKWICFFNDHHVICRSPIFIITIYFIIVIDPRTINESYRSPYLFIDHHIFIIFIITIFITIFIDRVFDGSPIVFPRNQRRQRSWILPPGDFRQLCDQRAPQWAKATEIVSVEKPVEKMALGGHENQEKPWEWPGTTRKNHGKLMEVWDFSTELGKKSFNVREWVGWTRKQQEREGSNPLRLSKLGYPICISKRFGVLFFATRHINIVP